MYKLRTSAVTILLLLAILYGRTNVSAMPVKENELNRQWWATKIYGEPVGKVRSLITLKLDLAVNSPNINGTVPPTNETIAYGSAGCNRYLTTYTVDAEKHLHFDYPVTSKMSCDNHLENDSSISVTEYKFIQAVVEVMRFEFTEVNGISTLTLFNDLDEEVLTFESEVPVQRIFLPTVMK